MQYPDDIGIAGEILADQVFFQIRLLRQENAIVIDDGQCTAGTDVQTVEELIEIAHAHRGHRNTQKLTCGRGNASAETDAPFIFFFTIAAGFERSADEHAGVVVEGMG
ncbi:hypothetical protein D3C76_1558200 [compost metagenome]